VVEKTAFQNNNCYELCLLRMNQMSFQEFWSFTTQKILIPGTFDELAAPRLLPNERQPFPPTISEFQARVNKLFDAIAKEPDAGKRQEQQDKLKTMWRQIETTAAIIITARDWPGRDYIIPSMGPSFEDKIDSEVERRLAIIRYEEELRAYDGTEEERGAGGGGARGT